MRNIPHHNLAKARIKDGFYASTDKNGNMGAFSFISPCGATLTVISSGSHDDIEWEHVSVSIKNRCPNWKEMCFVKDLFWGEEEAVIQFHPPKSVYINNHPNCLHLWKKRGEQPILPDNFLV